MSWLEGKGATVNQLYSSQAGLQCRVVQEWVPVCKALQCASFHDIAMTKS